MVVRFDDGQIERINPNRPKLLLLLEREFKVQQPETHEQVSWIAWQGLGRPGDSLEAWLDGVDDIDIEKKSDDGDESGEADPS
jgi:hypothetical protein